MENRERYRSVFSTVFKVSPEKFSEFFETEQMKEWDSISHLTLVTAIEDEFNIMLDTEDLLNFKSYEIGKSILQKYNIVVD